MNDVCIYCENAKEDEDHVPPRCLFPRGTWGLIVVPSCKKCNKKWGLDDEYIKTIFLMSDLIEGDARLDDKIQSALRALEKPEAKRFSEYVLSDVFVEPGYVTDDKMGFTADGDRIIRWAQRIMMGLFAARNGEITQVNDWKAFMLNMVAGVPTGQDMINGIGAYMNSHQPGVIGENLFRYWIIKETKRAVIFELYGKYLFSGMEMGSA